MSGTASINLAIELPLRNQIELASELQKMYDPKDPKFRKFGTPADFALKFGPRQEDYQRLIDFFSHNGLRVKRTYLSRDLLDVSGSVERVQGLFHVRLKNYRNKDGRIYHAPDRDPNLEFDLPINYIHGLDDYGIPKPMQLIQNRISTSAKTKKTSPNLGTGPWTQGWPFDGWDYRNIYVPGATLQGDGQTVALVEFDGFYPQDIQNYCSQMNPPIPTPVITVVPIDGGVSSISSNNEEVALDIEMVASMAPNAKILVYEQTDPDTQPHTPASDILQRIADDNSASQISCSWGWFNFSDITTVANVFQEFAYDGQSFFQASGDTGAYLASNPFTNLPPGPINESSLMTVVGGTELTTSGSLGVLGSYTSETTWNDPSERFNCSNSGGCNSVSGGGVCPSLPIPTYQAGFINLNNEGSPAYRNIPDVSMIAESVYIKYNNGGDGLSGGTSAAAPLWAGFMALVNERASQNSLGPIGFANPYLYNLAANPTSYASDFHDINDGSNNNYTGTGAYPAVTGYDLATGLGSPQLHLLYDLADVTPILPTITNILPNPVIGSNSWQSITITGNYFLNGASIKVTWSKPTPSGKTLAPSEVAFISSTKMIMNITTTTQADPSWTVKIVNPGGGPSNIFTFPVVTSSISTETPTLTKTVTPGASYTSTRTWTPSVNTPISTFTCTNTVTATPVVGGPTFTATPTSIQTSCDGNFLSAFGSGGNGTGQFSAPRDITIDKNDNIYVADTGNNRIEKFDKNGNFLLQWGTAGSGTGQFNNPVGIAFSPVNPVNFIYVADSYNNRIQVFDLNGNYQFQWGSVGSGQGQFGLPFGICIAGDGGVYVADTNNHRIQRFSSAGSYQMQFGSAGSGNGQFGLPDDVAVDQYDDTYVTDYGNNRVEKFDSNGTYMSQVGGSGSGPGKFSGDFAIVRDASGNLYVTDYYNFRIEKFDSNLGYISQWKSGVNEPNFAPEGIANSSTGNIYVSDAQNNQILIFGCATSTPTFSFTPTFSVSPTLSLTPSPTLTRSPTSTVSLTFSLTPTPLLTYSYTSTPTRTIAPSLTYTKSYTTVLPSSTGTATGTRTATATKTATPVNTSGTMTETDSATLTFSKTVTVTVTSNTTNDPVVTPTASETVDAGPGPAAPILIGPGAPSPGIDVFNPILAFIFTWDVAPRADYYTLTIIDLQSGSTVVAQDHILATGIAISLGSFYNGRSLKWNVRSNNAYGSAYSEDFFLQLNVGTPSVTPSPSPNFSPTLTATETATSTATLTATRSATSVGNGPSDTATNVPGSGQGPRAFPNPATSNELRIVVEPLSHPRSVRMYDLTGGKLSVTETIPSGARSVRLDVGGLAGGLYFVVIGDPEQLVKVALIH